MKKKQCCPDDVVTWSSIADCGLKLLTVLLALVIVFCINYGFFLSEKDCEKQEGIKYEMDQAQQLVVRSLQQNLLEGCFTTNRAIVDKGKIKAHELPDCTQLFKEKQ